MDRIWAAVNTKRRHPNADVHLRAVDVNPTIARELERRLIRAPGTADEEPDWKVHHESFQKQRTRPWNALGFRNVEAKPSRSGPQSAAREGRRIAPATGAGGPAAPICHPRGGLRLFPWCERAAALAAESGSGNAPPGGRLLGEQVRSGGSVGLEEDRAGLGERDDPGPSSLAAARAAAWRPNARQHPVPADRRETSPHRRGPQPPDRHAAPVHGSCVAPGWSRHRAGLGHLRGDTEAETPHGDYPQSGVPPASPPWHADCPVADPLA